MAGVLVTPADVRRYAIGLDDYLREYSSDSDEVDQKLIDPLIRSTEVAFERELRIKLKTTRIVSAVTAPAGLGTTYDLLDDPYNYLNRDWVGTVPKFVLRWRPVQSVSRFALKFKGDNIWLNVPDSWLHPKKQFGVLYVIPSGTDAAVMVGAAQIWLPLISGSFREGIPTFVEIDYVAGYDDDPSTADTDDLHELREGIAQACAKPLLTAARQLAVARGSISFDGLSESWSAGDFAQLTDQIDKDVANFKRSWSQTRTPPRMTFL